MTEPMTEHACATSAEAAVARAASLSRYLSRQLDARPGLRAELAASANRRLPEQDLGGLLPAQPLDENTVKEHLRRLRTRVFAHLMVRDLCGLADLSEVTAGMSALADLAIAAALHAQEEVLIARHGEPRNGKGERQRLMVIGMGKLGGRELNVSSDIDLVFVYPEEGDTAGPAVTSNFEFFSRLGRRLIETLAEITAGGQVFRVDMRLRPNGDSGPLVCSLDMLEQYFIAQGREWERYAWIKARPITGDRTTELAALVRPFVFRKYLDFGAINAMRELHGQIRREVSRREMIDNIKLGPGGIREIEFIAQVFQLIRGGRDPALQVRPTLEVLDALADRRLLAPGAVPELRAAYAFLRRLEHRLQYLEDAQTHTLPVRPEDQRLVARAMGFREYEALIEELDDHRGTVSRHFDAVFADPGRDRHDLSGLWSGAGAPTGARLELVRLGYRDPDAAGQRLAALRASGRYQQMPGSTRTRFDALIPRVVEQAAKRPNPDETLSRTLDLLEAISRRAAYLALLQQYPQALGKVCEMVSSSSWAAGYLTRHPLLLDELLDARILESAPDWPAFRGMLEQSLEEHSSDTERQMDLMREMHHAQVFRLLAQDLAGRLTVERLADHLSELADIMLDLTIATVWRKMPARHRESPRFAIVSYGKLGGKELGYASDLDLIFLFDDEAPEAPETYARFARRIVTWVSSHTPAGVLFDTDLRLRPNGEAGLLVTSLAALRKYQLESAWVWEHQALTRARFSAGDRSLGERFESLRSEVLRLPRDLDALRREVIEMRERMYGAHTNRSELFDLKHDRGGLIDVEFIVQYLVLGHSRAHPELTRNLGNIALLGIAGQLGLIDAKLAGEVRDTYREYRRLQHHLRLNGARYARVERSAVSDRIEQVGELWRQVLGAD